MSTWANNAIITKAKSMYGSFLKPDDYEKLIKFNSVADIASFLKKHPNYQAILKDIQENTVHRGNLESLIRKNTFDQVLRLSKLIYSKDEAFYKLNLVKQENEIILAVLRTFISEETDEKSVLPYFFNEHTELDMDKLIKAESFEDLLEAVKKTPYFDILKPYETNNPDNIRYLDIEHSLEKYYYDEAFKRIDKYYKGKLKKDLMSIFQTAIELKNITKIYRLKKFYHADPLTIKSVLIEEHSRISSKRIDEMIALNDPDDMLKYLAKSEYAQYTNDQDYIYIEYYAGKIKYDLAKKFMYFAQEVPKVYQSFIALSEIEIENITNIIEGVRYQINENEIKQMLIY